MLTSKTLLALLSGAVAVSAHGFVQQITINGQGNTGYDPTKAPWTPNQDSIGWENWATDLGFVLASNVQSEDIICHLRSKNAPKSAKVKAGETISLRWNQWPASHHGPIIDYIADCRGDCSTVNKNSLQWVKIAEQGQLSLGSGYGQPGRWAADRLIDSGLTWNVKIPSQLAPGKYVLRHEIIALHEGMNGAAQFYPQCMNLEVTGSGTKTLPSGTVGTQLYRSSDPGVRHNIYNDESRPNYVIPGPKLWTGAA